MLNLEQQMVAKREIAVKVLKDAETEIRALYPKRSGHWRRKEAKRLAERRLAQIAEAGDAEKQIGAVTGTRARIVID